MLMLMIEDQPHRPAPDLRRKPVRCLAHGGSAFSRVDGVDAPPAAVMCQESQTRGLAAGRRINMNKVTIIGIDLAKRVFHAHGAAADGSVVFRKRLTRAQVLPFLAGRPRCVVAMEACASAHEWGRAIQELGHDVRLIPPTYVKPYVKRQKNDMADAEAIAEAGSRPTMRFVAVKTEEQQARSMVFRTRDLLVRQRTQSINALRGHLAEHGVVAPQGPAHLKTLAAAMDGAGRSLPQLVRDVGGIYLEQIEQLNRRIADLEKVLRREAQFGTETRRLQTMPGIGPITAMAVEAFAPPMATFKRGRDFAAWLGLVPVQHSTGGEAAARSNVENGAARHPPASHYWRHGRHPMGVSPRG
jgi:transposase